MTSLFARLFKQSRITFDPKNVESIKTNLCSLKSLMDQVTISDLNLDPDIVSPETFKHKRSAPCKYVEIFENSHFTMAAFILREHFSMPLHDHPSMYGMLRVIAGQVRVLSYTEVSREQRGMRILVNQDPPKLLDAKIPGCAFLTPTDANFHEVHVAEGPAAFFDILSPPYNADIPIYGPRECSYYRRRKAENKHLILERIPEPDHYFCDTLDYELPEIILNESYKIL